MVIGWKRFPAPEMDAVPALRAFVCSADRDGFARGSKDFSHGRTFHDSRVLNQEARFALRRRGDTDGMEDIKDKRVAVVVGDGFEESELIEPIKALRTAGARVDIISQHSEPIQAFKHHQPTIKVEVDATLDQARPEEYDALLLPGGALNADGLRTDPKVQRFVKQMDSEGKPMAVICHAPWILVSAGLAEGRTLTSWPTIVDDLRNAGANWVDRDVVVDRNLLTSRGPKDLPAFNDEMMALFAHTKRPRVANASSRL
jgi:protease I